MVNAAELDADVAVVGAGAVGLAIAARLAETRSVVVIERNESFGLETTSHNTGIVHAGLFYETGSLKHRLCLRGNALIYEWCEARSVPVRRTGKLIVAIEEAELPALDELEARAAANAVPGMSRLTAEQSRAIEPAIPAVAALYSESSGVIDQWSFARSLEAAAREGGALFAYHHELRSARRDGGAIRLELAGPDGEPSDLRCGALVNAAGHGAPGVAATLGYPLDGGDIEGVATPPMRQRPNRGRYFDLVSTRLARVISRPVYPLPADRASVLERQARAGGLGLHLSVDIDGGVHLGPDTVWLDEDAPLDYSSDGSDAGKFLEAGRRLLPDLAPDDLAPGQTGYRPKLIAAPDGAPPDFLIWEHEGYVHLGGIESPGLTAALAIADEVADRLDGG